MLELTVPGFDTVTPIHVPAWSASGDVFTFAASYLLYFRLQGKMNFHYDDRTRSSIFLNALRYTDLADSVTTLQSHVNSFRDGIDDHYLPPHLRIHGLTTSIHQHAQAQLWDVISPRMRRMQAASELVQGPPRVYCFGGASDRSPRDYRDGRRGSDNHYRPNHDREGGFPRRDHDSPRSRNGHGRDSSARRQYGKRNSQGRITNPSRNRRPYLPDVQCAACRKVGHVAKHCDMLATAICLERYMKQDLSAAVRDTIEKEWLERWARVLDNPDKTPRQVLRAYVDGLDLTLDQLDDAIEWDCWDGDGDLESSSVE